MQERSWWQQSGSESKPLLRLPFGRAHGRTFLQAWSAIQCKQTLGADQQSTATPRFGNRQILKKSSQYDSACRQADLASPDSLLIFQRCPCHTDMFCYCGRGVIASREHSLACQRTNLATVGKVMGCWQHVFSLSQNDVSIGTLRTSATLLVHLSWQVVLACWSNSPVYCETSFWHVDRTPFQSQNYDSFGCWEFLTLLTQPIPRTYDKTGKRKTHHRSSKSTPATHPTQHSVEGKESMYQIQATVVMEQ